MTICSIADCDREQHARQMCHRHYNRWLRNGDPVRRPYREPSAPCWGVACSSTAYAHGWCIGHYRAWQRHAGVRLETVPGQSRHLGYIYESGYKGHPVADKRGRVLQHRRIMFDLFGPGAHACFYCPEVLPFLTGRQAIRGIQVDHLDSDRTNNEVLNLVFTCGKCNTRETGNHTDKAKEMAS